MLIIAIPIFVYNIGPDAKQIEEQRQQEMALREQEKQEKASAAARVAEAQEFERIMQPIRLSKSDLSGVTAINHRRDLSDPGLPRCPPPSEPPEGMSFTEIIQRDGVVDRGLLAVRVTGTLIFAAILEMMKVQIQTTGQYKKIDKVRVAKAIIQHVRSDQVAIVVFRLFQGRTISLSGPEPALWSEAHGKGRLIGMSANALTGVRAEGAPMLLSFQRRICEDDSAFSLRLYLDIDETWHSNPDRTLTFLQGGSLVAALGDAARSQQPFAGVDRNTPGAVEQEGANRPTSSIRLSTGDVINVIGIAVSVIELFVPFII